MLTVRSGAAGSMAGSRAMSEYLLAGTLKPDTARAAEYYTKSEAAAEQARSFWGGAVQRGVEKAGGTVAELRPDISPALAARLGIDDPKKPLTQEGFANLINATCVDGTAIEGRKKHSATWSIAEVFGLDPRQPPTAEAINNVLAGRRADGDVPRKVNCEKFSVAEVNGAGRRFRDTLGIPKDRELTYEERTNLENGLMANGRLIDRGDYRSQIHNTSAPLGYVDMTFSADKSLTAAWALAPSVHERDLLLNVHRQAVADTMTYVAQELGYTRRGQAGKGGIEEGEIGWINVLHYTSRPTVDIARVNEEGRAYTDRRELPLQTADPQLHTHVIVLNSVLTADGHVGTLDLSRLNGRVKEFGAIYQAHVATRARKLGIEVMRDERTEAARLTAVPHSVREHFSKRTVQSTDGAQELARKKGADWDALDGEQKVRLIKAVAAETRQAKEGGKTDFAVWHEQAVAAGYKHRTVLRQHKHSPEVSNEDRLQRAYEVALPVLEKEFRRRPVLKEQDLRRIAAQSFIEAGIGKKPGADIDAVMKAFNKQGVMQEGQRVKLEWAAPTIDKYGREVRQVTTGLFVEQERELVRLAKAAAADMSAALAAEKIERAAVAFLDRSPKVDRNDPQWKAQQAMATRLSTGGRLTAGIGAAGAGKTTMLEPLVDAWKAEGRQVYGAAIAWRQTNDLKSAGIEEGAAIAAFLKRVETGKYTLDRNTVLVVDEVGQVGAPKLLDLLRLQEKTGMQLVLVGDDKQCRQIEGAGSIELLRDALGEAAIPQILTSIRQKAEREREIADHFRNGRAHEALEMKQQDGTAILVAGGRQATIKQVAQTWMERTNANQSDPLYKLTVSTPTNADAREIGVAIRNELRQAGKLGRDVATIDATDPTGERYKLTLAIGDKVRLFDRVHDVNAQNRKKALAANGEIVEVRSVTREGLVIRNKDGIKGLVSWSKIRKQPDGPARLTYGYATTVDTAQGSTATEHIHAMPDGSQMMQGFKAYTAATRHEQTHWIIIDEASERRQLANRAMLGHKPQIGEPEVWQNVSENLSRQPLKPGALAMLRETTAQRLRARFGP